MKMDFFRHPYDPNAFNCVQVSEFSEENGGFDDGTVYCVEVLFNDGTWETVQHYRDLAQAQERARQEADERRYPLLPRSKWPNRQVTTARAT